MKILMSALLVAGTLLAPATLPALAATHVAIACPANAPEAWKRPGGYCEQIQSLDTIGTEKGSGTGCALDLADLGDMLPLTRLQVAIGNDPCNTELPPPPPPPCGSLGSSAFDLLPQGMLPKTDAVDLFAVC